MRLLFLVLLALGAPAAAQPSAAVLMRGWAGQQDRAAERVGFISAREEVVLHIAWPSAERRVVTTADTRHRPDGGARQREVRQVTVDGQPIPPDRQHRLERRLRRALGPDFGRARRLLNLPPRAFAAMEPVGRAVADEVDGRPAWRVALVAARPDAPLERATLWFSDADATRLLRSHAIARPAERRRRGGTHSSAPPPPGPEATAHYQRIAGLDVPVRRHVEAFAQQRRRIRTFTVRMSLALTLTDLSVQP